MYLFIYSMIWSYLVHRLGRMCTATAQEPQCIFVAKKYVNASVGFDQHRNQVITGYGIISPTHSRKLELFFCSSLNYCMFPKLTVIVFHGITQIQASFPVCKLRIETMFYKPLSSQIYSHK